MYKSEILDVVHCGSSSDPLDFPSCGMPIALCSYFHDAVTGGHLPLDYMIHVWRCEKILLLYAAYACEDYDGDTGFDDGDDDDKLQRHEHCATKWQENFKSLTHMGFLRSCIFLVRAFSGNFLRKFWGNLARIGSGAVYELLFRSVLHRNNCRFWKIQTI